MRMLVTGEITRDRETGCNLYVSAGEGEAGLDVLIIGERRREARVDLFLPGENMALLPELEKEEEQPAEGEAHVARFYSRDADWRPGLYRIELDLGESRGAFGWEMERLGKYALIVDCDAPSTGAAATAQGPVMLEVDEVYHDPVTDCTLFPVPESFDDDLNLVIEGERHADVVARVYRPGASRPLAADGRLDRVLADSDEPYILQYYSAEQDWPAGLYRLELELEGRVSEFAWRMDAPREQYIHILCDQDPRGRAAAGVTVDPTPTPPGALDEEEIRQGAPLFHVLTDNVLNLRGCGSTDCARVGQVPAGTKLPVFAIEGDWYEVLVNGELVWAAGWLTTRAPDTVLEDTSMILDERTGCTVLLGARQLFDVLHIMVGGELHEDVRFEFYLPGESNPLRHSERSVIGLEESDGTMVEHVYQGVLVTAGQPYRLLIELGDSSNLLEWYPGQSGGTAIFIICNDPEGIGSGTGPGPISSAATQIAQVPAESSGDGATPAGPGLLQTDVGWLDGDTGCEILVTDRRLDGDLNIWITSSRPEEVEVRIFRPDDGPLVPFSGRFRDENEERDIPLDWQYYDTDETWQDGTWELEIRRDGHTSRFAWQLENQGDQIISILCDAVGLTLSLTATAEAADSRQDGREAVRVTAEPAPARVLEIGETWRDPQTGCLVRLAPESPGQDFDVVLSGERRADVEVRVFRPGADQALPVSGRVGRVLVEGEAPVIQQNYSADQDWPWGLYRLEVELDGRVSAYAWRMEVPTDQFFLILCEEDRSGVPTAAAPTPAPTPPRVLETGVFYRDDHTGCDIIIGEEGVDGDLNLALAGDRYRDIEARVYRPGSDVPLRYTDRLDDTFAESDEEFIWQYYTVTTPWSDGLYRLEIELDGRVTQALWQLERGGDQVIYAFCNTDENRLPVATLTPTATVTPSPTVTATPTPTRTPVPTRARMLAPGRNLRDFITGCELYLEDEGLDGHFHLVLTESRQEEVEAWVYRPGEGTPYEYSSRRNETFDDSDEPFVWQIYRNFGGWPGGMYRLQIMLDGRVSELFWDLERGGDQVIYISCDRPVPRATVTATPSATWTPSPTLTPSPTWTPSPTPTPTPTEVGADIRTGAVHEDEATGCTVLVLEFPPEHPDWKDLWITRGGSGRDAVEVEVWLPDAEMPLPIDEMYEDVMETGESLVVQSYSPRTDWRNGLYRIDLGLGEEASSLTWRMSGPGYYAVSVTCDQAAGPAPSV